MTSLLPVSLPRFLYQALIGSFIGILAGTASAFFLASLAQITTVREANPMLLFGLPFAGLALGILYERWGSTAGRGSHLVIEEINLNSGLIPARMAPLVLFGTLVTHLFGGSAGREGTAVQMGASLADSLRRVLRLSMQDRRWILMAGLSGGFASVFGTPVAGVVFALEVPHSGRIRHWGLVPCLAAACVGDLVTRAWGVGHSHYPVMAVTPIDSFLILKIVLAALAFGLTSRLFIALTHAIKHQAARIKRLPVRLFIGGCLVIALTLLLGTTAYNGLSLPLLQASVHEGNIPTFAFLAKLILTAVTLSMGFMGGEVTPLFVIGATLGHTLGGVLGLDPAWVAMIGFTAVFAGATNTPLACTFMAVELFGGGSVLYVLIGCLIAYLASGQASVYTTQAVDTPEYE
jgi:H+/Cl- antiporter ClcA